MINHSGGPCPVAQNAKVKVYFRDGHFNDGEGALAGDWRWKWRDSGSEDYDIIGYNLLDAPAPAPAALGEDVRTGEACAKFVKWIAAQPTVQELLDNDECGGDFEAAYDCFIQEARRVKEKCDLRRHVRGRAQKQE